MGHTEADEPLGVHRQVGFGAGAVGEEIDAAGLARLGFSVQIFQSRPGSCAMDAASPCMVALISAPQGPWKGKSICRRMGTGISCWCGGA